MRTRAKFKLIKGHPLNIHNILDISTVALSGTDDDIDDCGGDDDADEDADEDADDDADDDDDDDDADDDACLYMRSPITVYAAAVGGQMIQHRHGQPLQLVSDDR